IQDRADSLEQFNQLLLESGQAGIVTIDASGRMAGINDRAVELLRLPGRELVGQPADKALAHLGDLKEAVMEAVQSGRVAAYQEYAELFDDEGDSMLGVSMTLIGAPDDDDTGLLVFVNDVTETARLRRELEDKKRLVALGEMAGGLAHQIRNSLGAISGYANLCRKQLRKAELPEDRAETLLSETKEAETLIGRFLTFARPFDFTPAPTRLDILVRETVDQFEVQQDSSNITFRVDAPQSVTISADQVLLKQVFANLIANAIQAYDGRPGMLEVAVETVGESVAVRVRDEAGGIPGDEIERIFTPFFSSRPSGTGLGLPLASRIVDLHRGRLTVESRLGDGSCFRVVLPLATIEEDRAPRSASVHNT
ncbi:PAS domain-containing protein, partial [candidate division GN15 bacterium]|nr:PAS domain-containing protein [candidate division GN15 bacterium]